MVESYCALLILSIAIMQLSVQLYGATTTSCAEQSLVVSWLFLPIHQCSFASSMYYSRHTGAILVMVENENDACKFDTNILVQR